MVEQHQTRAGAAGGSRHQALDLLRGLAALAVANYHFLSWNLGWDVDSMGTFTVYAFFTLSAVTMMMVYGRRFGASIDAAECGAFYLNRAARILPLLAAVSVVSFLYLARSGGDVAAGAARGFFTGSGLFAFHLPGMLSASVGAWSLGIEIAFYACFPLIALAATRASLGTLVAVLVLALGAQHLLLASLQPLLTEPARFWEAYVTPLTFAPFFLMGLIIYRLPSARTPGHAVLAVVALAATCAWSLVFPGRLYSQHGPYLLLTLLAGLAVYGAWRSDVPRLLRRPAHFLGEISYSLYLTHWVANDIALFASRRLGLALGAQWGLYLGVALVGSFLTLQFFEKPARRLIRSRQIVREPVATLP